MQDMPQKCFYRAEQTRELDARAIAAGIPGFTLMQRAGKAAWRALRLLHPRLRHVTIVCGGGNNGGDGYIVAGEALEEGMKVNLLSLSGPSTDTARQAAAAWLQAGGTVNEFQPERLGSTDIIVDALLGTGLDRAVEGSYRDAITAINASPAQVMALDIPSGLHADTGAVMGAAVKAALTMTFIGRKTGLYTAAGRRVCGRILFDSLGVPDSIYDDMPSDAREADVQQCLSWLPRRAADAHKGSSGRLLVAGGDWSMPGAAGLAGWTACATGAGLVRVATRPENVGQVSALAPEMLVSGISTPGEMLPLLDKVDAVLLGPGLGQSAWSRNIFEACLEHGKVAVIDADGLNLLADEPDRRNDWVLTPHPGEAARLLGISTTEVIHDRMAVAKEIAVRYGGICVLKGSGTIITTENHVPYLCTRGSAALATAGTGDVLAGLIASLVVQNMPALEAAVTAITLHAYAGDMAAGAGSSGMLASDLIRPLQRLRNTSRA